MRLIQLLQELMVTDNSDQEDYEVKIESVDLNPRNINSVRWEHQHKIVVLECAE